MSVIKVEIFGDECEVVDIKNDKSNLFVFEFSEELDGYLTFGGAVARADGKHCSIDSRHVGNGSHDPALSLDGRIIRLPRMVKLGKLISLERPSDEYIRDVSLRARILAVRVSELEEALKKLNQRVYGTSIFK